MSETTVGSWYYQRDGLMLREVASNLGLDEREVVRRIVHTYLAANADMVSALSRTEVDADVNETMEVTISANVDLFHELLEETGDLLMRTDTEGRITYLNPAAADLLGVPVLEAVGRRAIDLLHPEDRAATARAYQDAIREGRSRMQFENRALAPDGRVRYLSWNTGLHYDAARRLTSITAIARDMTEPRLMQQIHERNQQALLDLVKQRAFSGADLHAAIKAIVETASETLEVARVGIWLYHENDSRIECMDLYQREAGMHTEGGSLRAEDAPDYFQALEQDRVIAANDALADPHTAQLGEYLKANGIGAMLDAPIHVAGKTAGVICHEHVGGPRPWSLEDQNFAASLGDLISLVFEQAEKRRAEIEILRQTVALEKANELNHMMSDFVNLVAHELRTPLTSVIGFVELLEEQEDSGSAPSPYLQQIRQGFERLSRLIDDLLDFARLEAGTFALDKRPAQLDAKIRDVADSLMPQALDASIKLECDLPDAPIVLEFDPVRVGQVLLNLLTNAIKYTGQGGRVVVSARMVEGFVRVEVRDSGEAIPPEDLPRLFTKFTRLASATNTSGVGLGLHIAKSLVEAHGGQIGAESIQNQGSTFWFTLPLSPEPHG